MSGYRTLARDCSHPAASVLRKARDAGTSPAGRRASRTRRHLEEQGEPWGKVGAQAHGSQDSPPAGGSQVTFSPQRQPASRGGPRCPHDAGPADFCPGDPCGHRFTRLSVDGVFESCIHCGRTVHLWQRQSSQPGSSPDGTIRREPAQRSRRRRELDGVECGGSLDYTVSLPTAAASRNGPRRQQPSRFRALTGA